MLNSANNLTCAISRVWPSRPFVFLLLVYLLTMLVFALLRLFFLLNFTELLNDATIGEIATAFAIGVRFDQIVVLYVLLPLALVLPWVGLQRRPVRTVATGYVTALFSFVFLLLLSDIRFYSYFESHLNFLAYEYIGEGPTFWNQITADPMFLPFLALWLVLTALFTLAVIALTRRTRTVRERRSWVGQVIWFLAVLALMFVGIRGRVGLAPIDWGAAYFCQNRLLNQLSLNGVYVLGRNLTEHSGDLRLSSRDESERFPFVDFQIGLDSVRAALHQPGDEWLEPARSLRRITHQAERDLGFQPNVIVVLMESWSARNTGALGSSHDLTPHFDSLASRGILFTNFFASGVRTSFGLPATLGSFPSLPGRSIMGRYDALHPFVMLSEILHGRGYHNVFVYGGDLVFDNMEGFFTTKKYDRLYGENKLGKENAFSKWGIPDHVVFEKTIALIDSLPRPFQLTALTLSNHEPFDLPDSSTQRYRDSSDSSKIFNAQLYADHAVGLFAAALAHLAVLDSTIVLFTADHAKYGAGRYMLDPEIFHIPLLVYSPAIVGSNGRAVDKYGSQTDILPTLMGLLGGDYEHSSWGRDLLRLTEDDAGFAIINAGDRIGSVDGRYFYIEWLGRFNTTYELARLGEADAEITDQQTESALQLQRRTRMYMQIAEQLSTPATP